MKLLLAIKAATIAALTVLTMLTEKFFSLRTKTKIRITSLRRKKVTGRVQWVTQASLRHKICLTLRTAS